MLNKLLFKSLGLFSIVMLMAHAVFAQPGFLKKLVPHHARLQYGGGIGMVSAGIGYSNKNKKLEADLMYGYVPAGSLGVEIHSATLKFQWIPLKTLHKGNIFLQPLVTGILVNHSFGDQYFGFKPDDYPYSYYNFPTSINSALLLGSLVGTKFPGSKTIKGLGFYYEFSVFDRELASFVTNTRSLELHDILTIGFGFKVYLK